ncbi:hypothetical protein MVEG_03205 [Podila verticillata NRRL 6337]|nr:hypothetical protein MVEG_03205 [Podila verticillata NRRL 6337]
MSKEVAIYVFAFLGMTGIMGIFALMIYRKHQRQLQQNLVYIQVIHDRRQQAIDLNLPPFYVDHIRDPVVLDLAPSLEAVMVEAGNGQIHNPSTTSSSPSSSPATSRPFTVVATDLESISGGRESILPPLTRPRIVTLSSATSSSAASALATVQTSSPSLVPVVTEEIDLSDLLPPPSYDVPNIVVERSPTLEPSPLTSGSVPALSLALGSNASALSLLLSPSLAATSASIASTMERNEASVSSSLGNRHNSETEPNQGQTTPSNQQRDLHFQQCQPSDAIAAETPRYSAEFDPSVPHEVHLQQYRRARALSDSSSRPSLAFTAHWSSGPSIVAVSSYESV